MTVHSVSEFPQKMRAVSYSAYGGSAEGLEVILTTNNLFLFFRHFNKSCKRDPLTTILGNHLPVKEKGLVCTPSIAIYNLPLGMISSSIAAVRDPCTAHSLLLS